jgi:hypothetical protein
MKTKWLLLLLLIAGCQPARPASPATGTATPWPGYVYTQDIESLRPVLFKAEDMDWPAETYRELTEVPEFDLLVAHQDQAEAMMRTHPLPLESHKSEPRPQGVGVYQTVWSFADEATAIQAFEAESYRYSLALGRASGIQFEPEIENVLIGCNSASGPEYGSYQNCGFMIQYGHYLTTGQMPVDGDYATMDD